MDYKKKYLKYKLKYLNTKKMLTGGDTLEKNNNNDFKDSQVRSKKLGGMYEYIFGESKPPPPGPSVTWMRKMNKAETECVDCNDKEQCYFDSYKAAQLKIPMAPC